MSFQDRYGPDVLARHRAEKLGRNRRKVEVTRGLVLEHAGSEWCGAVVGVSDGGVVKLEDARGQVQAFPVSDLYLIDGEPVSLLVPTRAAATRITASGSVAAPEARARVAQASRIFVEGRHDAELVEKVWGEDLRGVGVVVELLDGAENLAQVLADFGPMPQRRAAVLLDHLVAGTKETRIAEQAAAPYGTNVKILGHPFIDIWQAVKPQRLNLEVWPVIPRGTEWKQGICRKLGWPSAQQADIANAWRHILAQVRDYRDLETELVARVEELIDFVTEPLG